MASGEADEKAKRRCEVIEKQLGDNPASILYSDSREELISYRQKVMEIEKDKDDYLYSMAGHKGETFNTLGLKTVADLASFEERFIEELNGRRNN